MHLQKKSAATLQGALCFSMKKFFHKFSTSVSLQGVPSFFNQHGILAISNPWKREWICQADATKDIKRWNIALLKRHVMLFVFLHIFAKREQSTGGEVKIENRAKNQRNNDQRNPKADGDPTNPVYFIYFIYFIWVVFNPKFPIIFLRSLLACLVVFSVFMKYHISCFICLIPDNMHKTLSMLGILVKARVLGGAISSI